MPRSAAAAATTTADSDERRLHRNDDIPRPPRPIDSVRLPAAQSVSNGACRSSLTKRVKELQLPKHDAVQNSRMVDELSKIILDTLKKSYPLSFRWDKFNSGSYFDKTKVRYS